VLGVVPALGRDFQTDDDRFNGPSVVILSDRMWRRRFNADPAIIGRKIKLEMTAYQQVLNDLFTVIGVMPASFENVTAPEAELWAPLQYDPALKPNSREWGHHLHMIARLRPGVSRAQAANRLDTLLPSLGQRYAQGFTSGGGVPQGIIVASMHDELIAGVKPALLAIVGAVILVLIIACVNVTNLLLARGAQRRGEFAMRSALGAGPGRLVRQLLTESLAMSLIGGIFALAVAQLGVKALVALSPAELPRAGDIRIDTAVYIFAFIVTSAVGLAVGLIPAINASRSDPQSALQQSTRSTSRRQQFVRRCLVVSEVSLALVLLVSAGLLFHSLKRLFSIDPGFDGSHLLTMQVQESGGRFAQDGPRARFFEQALENVRHLPGVVSAAFTSQLPLSGDYESYGIEYEAYPHDYDVGYRYAVSPGYFETMHIPLVRGRLLNENDRAGAPVAVVISESLAKRRFAGRDPLGQRVRMGPGMGQANHPWGTIVGVVGDVKQLSLALNEPDAFYTTDTQWDWVDSTQSVVVRARGDAAALAPAVRAAIWSVDKDQPIVRVATMASLIATSEAQRRFALILFEAFAIVALILAATGLYGVLAGSVTERTREIGVRTALGASRNEILTLIIRQGMRLCALGIAIGVIVATLTTRALTTLLFGISSLDPVTYASVVVVIFTVSLVACSLPAWRAARVDPSIALRTE
jgi:putative ABC transport system permease protein